MASTFSPTLRAELIADGEQAGTWGGTTNTNLESVFEAAIAGYTSVTTVSAQQALTIANGVADQARSAMLALNTATGANYEVFAPPVSKLYAVVNLSATYTVTIYNSTVAGNTTAAGDGVAVPPLQRLFMMTDGTDFAVLGSLSSSANTANTVVLRDGSGNFAAGTITASLTGNVTGNVTGALTGNADTVTNGVYTTGDQTIAGVKTFSSSPVVPAGATGAQAARAEELVKWTGVTGAYIGSAGTTAQRPGSPALPYRRWNTTFGAWETYNGTDWVPDGPVYTAEVSAAGSTITQAVEAGRFRRIVVVLRGISASTTANYTLQLGTGATLTTTGYAGGYVRYTTSGATNQASNVDTGIRVAQELSPSASFALDGEVVLKNISGNLWFYTGTTRAREAGASFVFSGEITLADDLDIIGLTTGAGTFDSGGMSLDLFPMQAA